jgi:hypothetical protein
MSEFKSWDAYSQFRHEIVRQRRYIRSPEAEDFLRAAALTCKKRIIAVEEGQVFWRAQLGNDWRAHEEFAGVEIPTAHSPSRMKPLSNSAAEGRANPKGIPCLYLATTKDAAMSEVRPWVGALVSLAAFKIVRPLNIIDCSVLHGQFHKLALFDRKFFEPVPPEKFDEIVWAAIDTAFAEPVTRADDTADYAPTQTLAELFRTEGYDGIAYKSHFGDDGYNVALFDLESAKQVSGAVFKTKTIKFEFEKHGDQYFIKELAAGETKA